MEAQGAHVVVGDEGPQRYAGTRVVRVEVEEAPALGADEVVGCRRTTGKCRAARR
jgi:hypothetical protein